MSLLQNATRVCVIQCKPCLCHVRQTVPVSHNDTMLVLHNYYAVGLCRTMQCLYHTIQTLSLLHNANSVCVTQRKQCTIQYKQCLYHTMQKWLYLCHTKQTMCVHHNTNSVCATQCKQCLCYTIQAVSVLHNTSSVCVTLTGANFLFTFHASDRKLMQAPPTQDGFRLQGRAERKWARDPECFCCVHTKNK